MLSQDKVILVTGATGTQGGAVAAALLKKDNRVRIMTRAASRYTVGAVALESAGAEVVIADLEDMPSLEAALAGVHGVYSVQGMDNGTDSERRQINTLVRAAEKMDVAHIVHASVCQTGNHEQFPGWQEHRWDRKYWMDKHYGEEAVRKSAIPHWTLLRPAFFMDNFQGAKAAFLFPGLDREELLTGINTTARLHLIAADDIGTFATAAFNNMPLFDRQVIDLAGDMLTITEIAAGLQAVTGRPVNTMHLSEAAFVQRGMDPAFANFNEWINQVGYRVDMERLRQYGLPLTSFRQWLERYMR
ncbi:NAD(P)H-binding protein [Chitinophaga agrisoli]|uniref:NAD(P)H-binding protein n=1 Tax=Chitinophaga agrisoli TaxID=2607653 RepID=A0A5B2VM38_9BACT|nr:NmrA family NAD(P)-binding protein [Chitinophaga agrisoli]KAA2239566.1 NAD(P)H-binding protein [Chitinophaga agrisoli]